MTDTTAATKQHLCSSCNDTFGNAGALAIHERHCGADDDPGARAPVRPDTGKISSQIPNIIWSINPSQ